MKSWPAIMGLHLILTTTPPYSLELRHDFFHFMPFFCASAAGIVQLRGGLLEIEECLFRFYLRWSPGPDVRQGPAVQGG